MCTIGIDNTITNQAFEGLQIKQLVRKDKLEILSISLAKGAIFPNHESSEDAHLIVLEGQIVFYIENQQITLKEQQHFSFSKDVEHWVQADLDSKFLIIR